MKCYNDKDISDTLKVIDEHIKDKQASAGDWRTYGC